MIALTFFSILFTTGVWFYLPTHLAIILSRAKYYLSGDSSPLSSGSDDPLRTPGGKASASYVMGMLGDYSEYAYAGIVDGVQRLINTWRASMSIANATASGAEL